MRLDPLHAMLVGIFVIVPLLATLIASHEARAWLRGTGSIRQTLSNAGCGFLFLFTQLALRGALLSVYAGVASLVPWKLPERSAWAWALAFVLLDLVYYVQHRLEHAVPLLWAAHAVHHQSHDYNLSVSFRVGVFASLSTLGFHLVLALGGVSATLYAAVATVHAALLFMLHARTKFRLGPGRFFNAPVFHRVHHGAERAYIDKNFGGVFLVFDRCFGTFAPYAVEPTFGVAGEASPHDPIEANLAPYVVLRQAMRAERTWLGKFAVLFVRRRPTGSGDQ
jgi:sterol desaturase/sphingolipid hydroxylase (fatty acid hydroxylase superfamily)